VKPDSRTPHGQLRLRVSRATDRGDEVLFGGKPWKKIG